MIKSSYDAATGQLAVATMTPEEVAAWEAEQAAYIPPEAPPYRLYKSVFVRRFTSPEAATMEALLLAEDPWLRMLYNSVDYFLSDDALFTYLSYVLDAALVPGRAAILLAAP